MKVNIFKSLMPYLVCRQKDITSQVVFRMLKEYVGSGILIYRPPLIPCDESFKKTDTK